MTEQYLKEFERWVAGPKERKARLRAELEEHLRAAEAAGDTSALGRLGTPREAAETFASGYEWEPAPLPRRITAALIDLVTFVGSIILFVGIGTGLSATNIGPVEALFIVATFGSFLWWGIGLTLVEWRTGRTPGKAILGLRTIAESGTAPSFGQVVLRRLTLVFSGPLQLIDWVFVFFNPKHQRGLDVLAKTLVVTDPSDAAAPVGAAVNALP